jgi:hypothetical protein
MVYNYDETLGRMRRMGNKDVFGNDIFPEEEDDDDGYDDDGDDDDDE